MAERKRRSGTTLHDVAKDAGVSFSAVSRALRNAYGVSDEMRARVQASAEKLGYRPHAAARGMRGKTFTLGVILSDLFNPFFSALFDGIASACTPAGYHPMLGIGYATATTENPLIDAMIDRQMDGLILVGPALPPTDLAIVAEEVPTVVIGLHQRDAALFDTVNNDDEEAGRLVVRHLAGQGLSRIAFLTLEPIPGTSGTTFAAREAGYRAEMARLGLGAHVEVAQARMDSASIRSTALSLLSGRRRPQAVFCWTDYVAFEVIGVAHELGLRIPEDLAVVGHDNTPLCALPQHDLSSVDQSGSMVGRKAAELLVSRIGGRTASEHVTVTPRLVERGSSRVPVPTTPG